MFMSRSFRVVASLMSLWGIAWWTCMQNVGTWRMLGECSPRCHFETWSLGPPYLEDLPCMGMVRRRLLNILNICAKKMYNQMIPLLFVFCQLVAMQVWCMEACAALLNTFVSSPSAKDSTAQLQKLIQITYQPLQELQMKYSELTLIVVIRLSIIMDSNLLNC